MFVPIPPTSGARTRMYVCVCVCVCVCTCGDICSGSVAIFLRASRSRLPLVQLPRYPVRGLRERKHRSRSFRALKCTRMTFPPCAVPSRALTIADRTSDVVNRTIGQSVVAIFNRSSACSYVRASCIRAFAIESKMVLPISLTLAAVPSFESFVANPTIFHVSIKGSEIISKFKESSCKLA